MTMILPHRLEDRESLPCGDGRLPLAPDDSGVSDAKKDRTSYIFSNWMGWRPTRRGLTGWFVREPVV